MKLSSIFLTISFKIACTAILIRGIHKLCAQKRGGRDSSSNAHTSKTCLDVVKGETVTVAPCTSDAIQM